MGAGLYILAGPALGATAILVERAVRIKLQHRHHPAGSIADPPVKPPNSPSAVDEPKSVPRATERSR